MQVYKVGRACDAGARAKMYPKGSILIARLPVSRMRDAERVLLSICRLKFIPRRDFGSEYFETDVFQVVGVLVIVATMFRVSLDDVA